MDLTDFRKAEIYGPDHWLALLAYLDRIGESSLLDGFYSSPECGRSANQNFNPVPQGMLDGMEICRKYLFIYAAGLPETQPRLHHQSSEHRISLPRSFNSPCSVTQTGDTPPPSAEPDNHQEDTPCPPTENGENSGWGFEATFDFDKYMEGPDVGSHHQDEAE